MHTAFQILKLLDYSSRNLKQIIFGGGLIPLLLWFAVIFLSVSNLKGNTMQRGSMSNSKELCKPIILKLVSSKSVGK